MGDCTLRLWNVIAATLIVSGLAAGQSAAAGLLSFTRVLLVLEATAERCEPQWKMGTHIPRIDGTIALLREAMVHNATLLKPGTDEMKLRTEVAVFVEKWRKEATATPPIPCDTTKLAVSMKALNDPAVPEGIKRGGETLLPYDTLQHLGGHVEAPTTYALPVTQVNVLNGIVNNLGGTCKEPNITHVELVSRSLQEDVTDLPPFVLAPITYRERWVVECASHKLMMIATFSQDSEGPTGAFMVGPDDGKPNDR
jgi:hypothetical protein